jgi:CheY-like chemotaxis protein
MVMPGDMTGLDLAVRLKKEKNSLIIIISSGYSAELAGGTLIAGQEVNCLPKPYQGGALAKMVRICLDQR